MARLGRGFPNNPIMRAPILVKAGPRWDSTGAGAVQTPTWTHTMGPLVNAVVVLGYWVTNSGSGNALVSVNGTSVPTVTGGTIGSYGSGTLYSGGAGTTGTYFPTLCSIPTGAQTFTLSLPGGTSWDYAFNSFAYTNVKSIGTGTSATGASLNAALSMTLTPIRSRLGHSVERPTPPREQGSATSPLCSGGIRHRCRERHIRSRPASLRQGSSRLPRRTLRRAGDVLRFPSLRNRPPRSGVSEWRGHRCLADIEKPAWPRRNTTYSY